MSDLINENYISIEDAAMFLNIKICYFAQVDKR